MIQEKQVSAEKKRRKWEEKKCIKQKMNKHVWKCNESFKIKLNRTIFWDILILIKPDWKSI